MRHIQMRYPAPRTAAGIYKNTFPYGMVVCAELVLRPSGSHIISLQHSGVCLLFSVMRLNHLEVMCSQCTPCCLLDRRICTKTWMDLLLEAVPTLNIIYLKLCLATETRADSYTSYEAFVQILLLNVGLLA